MSTPTIHVVPHTHWDREWHRPFQDLRLRLVEMMDQLLDLMEREPDLTFTLDGQMASVDDYLEVRPDAEGRIRSLISAGRLAVGPWQVLMDEFLVSGETIVRDLELGMGRARELGGGMDIGYLPDMFGHAAQMPQILARAGIDRAIVWRGVPEAIDGHVFTWEAPDGSAVAAEYLVDGYGNAAYLFAIPARVAERAAAFRQTMAPFFGDDDLLAMHGADHTQPVTDLVKLVRAHNSRATDGHLRITTLSGYSATSRHPTKEDPLWRGEMRSGARANLLMGVVSTRMDLRVAAARAERALIRYAEPLCALHGDAGTRPLLELAWRRIVANSAHDSICGCSSDEVSRQVMVRYDEARQIAEGLVRQVADGVARRAGRDGIAVLNPSAAGRADVVAMDLPVPADYGEVALELFDGRRLSTQELGRIAPVLHRTSVLGSELGSIFEIAHGRELFGREVNGYRTEEAGGIPRLILDVDVVADPPSLDMDALRTEIGTAGRARPNDEWELVIAGRARRTLLARVPAPALGWATARLTEGGGELEDGVGAGDFYLDNGRVRVEADERGELVVVGGGARLAGVGRLVDGGDAGDSYNYAPPSSDEQIADPEEVGVSVAAEGPLTAVMEISRRYEWPSRSDARRRSDERASVEVLTVVEVRAGEPFVRLRVAFDNSCRDHRLRWHVPLPTPADRSWAEGQFAVVERGVTAEGGHGEAPLPTFPAHGMVSVAGVSVLLDHVVEYELTDGGRELALTLLRATGMISRNEHALRREPAGPEMAIPGGQCIGPIELSFALYPHAAPWEEADSLAELERYAHPFVVAAGTAEPSRTPLAAEGLEVTGPGVGLSSLRARGRDLEVRLVCMRSKAASATLRGEFRAAAVTDLLGTEREPLDAEDGEAQISLGPWEIATLRLTR